MSNFYNCLNAEQIHAAYSLIRFLRRLRITGTLETRTLRAIRPTEVLDHYDTIDDTLSLYAIEKIKYDNSKSILDQEEILERLFGRPSQGLRSSY